MENKYVEIAKKLDILKNSYSSFEHSNIDKSSKLIILDDIYSSGSTMNVVGGLLL